jgi:hypothetical protein
MGYNKIDEIGAIEEMVKKYPNDSELGKKIREHFIAKGIYENTVAVVKANK